MEGYGPENIGNIGFTYDFLLIFGTEFDVFI